MPAYSIVTGHALFVQKTFTEVTAPKSIESTNSTTPAYMNGGFMPSLFYQKTFTEVTAPKSIVYTNFTTGAYSIFTGYALFVQNPSLWSQHLNPARLPIPPYPHMCGGSITAAFHQNPPLFWPSAGPFAPFGTLPPRRRSQWPIRHSKRSPSASAASENDTLVRKALWPPRRGHSPSPPPPQSRGGRRPCV